MIAVCLHGFLRSGLSMAFIARRLQKLGYKTIIRPTYPYHRLPLSTIAERLARTITETLEQHQATHVDVVTYSMGGLLFRACLEHDIPFRRVLMIAPPNQGAEMAERMRRRIPIHKLGWDPLAPLLPLVPTRLPEPRSNIEVGILAGIKGNQEGFNRLLSSDNDGKVRLEETFLSVETAHHIVHARHPMMIVRPNILDISTFFMTHGHFPTE